MQKIQELANKIIDNVSKVIIGNNETTKLIITTILAGGHILMEDMPGTGKTMMAKTIASSMDAAFKRVQFTPDLMPSDITGLNVYNQKESEFKLVKGPVFTNILLADEINRATPRTQSSLLEAMEEKQVTIDGNTMKLQEPFIVIATENPLETTGTYPLPEAQLDRFMMKISMSVSDKKNELTIIDRFIKDNPLETLEKCCGIDDINEAKKIITDVYIHDCVRDYLVDIILATRDDNRTVAGVSTRGTLALVRCAQAYAAIHGRKYVIPDDIKLLAPHVLGHRISVFGGGSSNQGSEIIKSIVSTIKVPVEKWEI